MEELINEFRCMVGAYYGVKSMDEYEVKENVLYDIKKYIIDFVENNKIDDFDYYKEAESVKEKVSNITKLQDSIIILSRIDAPLDLILMIKKKLKNIKK